MQNPLFSIIPFLILTGLLFTSLAEAASGPDSRLASLLPKGARWALVVLDRESGRELIARGNSLNTPLVPASVEKLVTTGAVLDAVDRGEIAPEAFVGAGRVKKGRAKGGRPDAGAGLRLDRYLRYMNVHSVNYMAENLFLAMGVKRFGPPASQAKGRAAIACYLATFDNLKGKFAVVDGSGLSRKDRVTARAMAGYLQQVSRRRWFPRFLATLPRPGVEGTVRNLGYVNGRFRVKSGRLDDVFSLAGYAVDRRGREVVFAFMVNFRGKSSDRRHSRGNLLRLIAEGDLSPSAEK